MTPGEQRGHDLLGGVFDRFKAVEASSNPNAYVILSREEVLVVVERIRTMKGIING